MSENVTGNLVEAVVFDIDGVLINSYASVIMEGIDLIAEYRGYSFADDVVRVFEANVRSNVPEEVIPEILGLDPSGEEWRAKRQKLFVLHAQLFEKHMSLMTPFPGSLQLLEDVARVKPVAGLTSRSRYMLTPEACPGLIPAENPGKYLPHIISIDDVKEPKPNPEGLLILSDLLGVVPERIAMVGDLPSDIITARRAGALPIGLAGLSPFSNEKALMDAGAHCVVNSYGELREVLGIA